MRLSVPPTRPVTSPATGPVTGPVRGKLLAAAVASMLAGSAVGQTKTLYIGMNGGLMERTYTQHAFPAFEKQYGGRGAVVPGTSSDILAKARAHKERPQMHLMFLDDGIMVRAIGIGLCERQRPNPHVNDIHPAARLRAGLASGAALTM